MEKVAIFAFGSRKNHQMIGGGTIKLLDELLAEIIAQLKSVSWLKRAVPEQYPIVRTLQLVAHFRGSLQKALS